MRDMKWFAAQPASSTYGPLRRCLARADQTRETTVTPSFSRSAHRLVRALGVVVGLGISFALASEYLQAQTPPVVPPQDPRISVRERVECLASGEARTSRQLRTGAIRFVGTEPGRPIPHPLPLEAAQSPEAAARSYLSTCGSLFGLFDQSSELAMTGSVQANGGRSVVRFQQTERGVPIMGAELVVHLDEARNILAVAGEMLPRANQDAIPSIDPAVAVQTAIDLVARTHNADPATFETTRPELWFYSPALIGPRTGPAALVWRIEVTPRTLMPIRELVLVDARRGNVPLHFNQIETVKNRLTYTANNTTSLPGTLVCNESNPTCTGGDADAVAAHVYAGDTYDFYFTNHGRDSLNNLGMPLTSTVHFGPVGFQNAFWNGAQMAYGDGFSLADDVVGHELTHGVTQFSSNLFYYYQSGAINESFSDVFGEFIDLTNGRGNDTAPVRWLLGEEVPGIGAIRNMQNPPAFGSPDKMTSAFYWFGDDDNGGVHFNSGINNKAAYLMVDGGTFNGHTIFALGIPKVAKIYYEVQTNLLTSGADYGDLYDALFQGCSNLVGTFGITPADCLQVRNAALAVEMNLQPAPGFNPEAPVCAVGQTPATIFLDNIETGGGNFAVMTLVGVPRWFLTTGYAHSGTTSLVGDDFPATIADSAVALANSILLPSNAFLHFAHAFAFESPNFDGGVIEYSTNGGANWLDAAPLIDANGYTGTIAGGFGNPLANRSAFIGISHGYISTRLNLSTLAGQSVRFRWRMGLDSEGLALGWFVDDVHVYTCAGASITQVTPNVGYQGQVNLNVAVTGDSTHFVQGQSFATFGPGITVNSTTVTDATHATVNVTIASNAALGARTVIVTTGAETAAALNAFTVTRPPILIQVVPNRGQPGANLNVVVTGQLTHFAQGQTIANFGAGITVNSTTVTDATHAIVNLTIPGNAAIGARTVMLSTGPEVPTLPNGFAVTSNLPDIPPLAYVVGRRLSPTQGGTDGTQTVSVIDTSTNVVITTVNAGTGCFCVGPDGVAVTPDGALVYVTNELDNTVSVIRTATNSVIAAIAVGNGPSAVVVSRDGTRAYVLNGSSSTSVSVIDTSTNAVIATIPLGVIQARGIAVAPNGTRVYAATYGSNSVKVIDTASNTVITTIPVGPLPLGVDTSPDGSLVYVANLNGSSVSAISTASNTVVATIPVGSQPYSARFAPDGSRAYVANVGTGTVSVIDTATHSVLTTIPSMFGQTLEFTPDGTRAYVAGGGAVRIIDTATTTGIGTIPFNTTTQGNPGSIAMSSGPSRIISLSGNLSFGPTRRGSTSTAILSIRNSGNSILTVTGIVFPPGFSGNWAGGTIAPGATQNVVVTFAPTVSTPYAGVVTVNGNQTGGTATIAVSGLVASELTRDNDFDGDARSDIAVYRPGTGQWFIRKSIGDYTTWDTHQWGAAEDVPVPGDYDGDTKADIAVYRPSTGQWFIRVSSTNYGTWLTYQWGGAGDIPVRGDFDGDGKNDITVFRPGAGLWFVLRSSSNFTTWDTYQWGTGGDQPLAGDFDGDGRSDIAVFRPGVGLWFVLRSSSGFTTWDTYQWGAAEDVPVPGDYDADGRMDVGVYRPSSGHWFILKSSTNYNTWDTYQWGGPGDTPVPGDYDGDGKTEVAVFRTPAGHWFILLSSTNYSSWATYQWGGAGDIPIPKTP
jgi:bacillolysin